MSPQERSNRRAKRVKWLLNNPHLWTGFPDSKRYVIDNGYQQNRWRSIVILMKEMGLVSEKTYWRDVNLVNLVAEARILRSSQR